MLLGAANMACHTNELPAAQQFQHIASNIVILAIIIIKISPVNALRYTCLIHYLRHFTQTNLSTN